MKITQKNASKPAGNDLKNISAERVILPLIFQKKRHMKFPAPGSAQWIAELIQAVVAGNVTSSATGINEIHKVETGDIVFRGSFEKMTQPEQKQFERLERFAELVAAREREACAVAVDGYPDCADAIRARVQRLSLTSPL